MAHESRWDKAVGDIYDAALAPGGLLSIAATLTELADGGSTHLSLRAADGSTEAVCHGLSDEALPRYAAHYHRLNPCTPIARERGLFHITRVKDYMSDQEFQRTEFYSDFLRVFDTVRIMGTPQVSIASDYALEIGVHRGARNRDFSDGSVRRLQHVLPHLRRALQLRRRLGGLDYSDIGIAVLEAFAFGCVVCDATGRVIFANAAARCLEAEDRIVLAASRHGIGAPEAGQSRKLAAVVAETALGGTGGAMALTAADGRRLFAMVTPLPLRLAWHPDHVLVTLRSEDAEPPFNTERLRIVFGLTPAEARLSVSLAAGRSLAEIGAELRLSENTLRTHIASVLRKTDTANQRELVRMLNLPPPMRGA